MKTFRAKIDADKQVLKMYNPASWNEYLSELKGDVIITVSQPKDMRSKAQNNHYWGILDLLLKDENFAGYTRSELHETFKERFEVESTRDLTEEQFTSYLNDIRRFAVEFAGIYLKEPDEY